MNKLDQFESIFKSASKERFHYNPAALSKILVVTDLPEPDAAQYTERLRSFLQRPDASTTWNTISREQLPDLGGLLDTLQSKQPDLICTHRNLKSQGWRWPYSLGEYLDVLTQATQTPVLVFPHPEKKQTLDQLPTLSRVMAVTDHLAGDDRLVNFALSITPKEGSLFLTHIEDQQTFQRYLDIISKIPSLDTEVARTTIEKQLLKEPHDYIQSCRDALQQHTYPLRIEEIVQMGSHLGEYKRLIQEHQIHLLVLNTKDADQLAMHGLAYPLAIELTEIPLLML